MHRSAIAPDRSEPRSSAGVEVHAPEAMDHTSVSLGRPPGSPTRTEHLAIDSSNLHGLEVAVVVGSDHVDDRTLPVAGMLVPEWPASDERRDGLELERLYQAVGDRTRHRLRRGVELAPRGSSNRYTLPLPSVERRSDGDPLWRRHVMPRSPLLCGPTGGARYTGTQRGMPGGSAPSLRR